MVYFEYGEKEISHLTKKDKKLGDAILQIGRVRREVMPDLFSALVYQIICQQVSTKGAATVWDRVQTELGEVTPKTVVMAADEQIQRCGTSMRKVSYIKEMAMRVHDGEIKLDELHEMCDEEVCENLSSLKGIGVWTAQMLMTFSMQRPNIMSYGDMAIHRGLRMLYRHRTVSIELFEKYRRRYSPYATVASLYLWEIAGGAIAELTDPAKEANLL